MWFLSVILCDIFFVGGVVFFACFCYSMLFDLCLLFLFYIHLRGFSVIVFGLFDFLCDFLLLFASFSICVVSRCFRCSFC